jgi:uncharacterized membrane protein
MRAIASRVPWTTRDLGMGARHAANTQRVPGVLGYVIVTWEAHRVVSFRTAETHTRSVLKAISWRTMGTLDTFAISWFMTGRVEIAGSIAGLEIITKIAWYYLHERVWAAIPWGRR